MCDTTNASGDGERVFVNCLKIITVFQFAGYYTKQVFILRECLAVGLTNNQWTQKQQSINVLNP